MAEKENMNEAKDYFHNPNSSSTELTLVKEVTKEHKEQIEHSGVTNPAVHEKGKGKKRAKKFSKTKKRFYAFNVDLYAIIILHKIGIYSYINFINQSFEHAPSNIKRALVGNIDQMYISTFMFTYFSYFLVSYFLGHGKTIGLTVFQLRTVSHEGNPRELSFMESFMRTLGYTVNYLMIFTPFLINLFRKDKKGLPDFFSQTEIMTDKEFLHYEHEVTKEMKKESQKNLKNDLSQTQEESKTSDADIIHFPIQGEPHSNIGNEKIDENAKQLDLFIA